MHSFGILGVFRSQLNEYAAKPLAAFAEPAPAPPPVVADPPKEDPGTIAAEAET